MNDPCLPFWSMLDCSIEPYVESDESESSSPIFDSPGSPDPNLKNSILVTEKTTISSALRTCKEDSGCNLSFTDEEQLGSFIDAGRSALIAYLTPNSGIDEFDLKGCSIRAKKSENTFRIAQTGTFWTENMDIPELHKRVMKELCTKMISPLNCSQVDTYSINTCPECIPPMWMSSFEIDYDSCIGYCEHYTKRIILYSDTSLPAAVHLVSAWNNVLLIDTEEKPNYLRSQSLVTLQCVPELSDAPNSRMGWLILHLLNATWAYKPNHRHGEITIDLSFSLWFHKLAGSSSSANFRTNLMTGHIEDELAFQSWAIHSVDLSIAYAVYHEALCQGSNSISREAWSIPTFVEVKWVDFSVPQIPETPTLQLDIEECIPLPLRERITAARVLRESEILLAKAGSANIRLQNLKRTYPELFSETVIPTITIGNVNVYLDALDSVEFPFYFSERSEWEGERYESKSISTSPDSYSDDGYSDYCYDDMEFEILESYPESSVPTPSSETVVVSIVTPLTLLEEKEEEEPEELEEQETVVTIKDKKKTPKRDEPMEVSKECQILLRDQLQIITASHEEEPLSEINYHNMTTQISFREQPSCQFRPGEHTWKGEKWAPFITELEPTVLIKSVSPKDLTYKPSTGVVYGQTFGQTLPFNFPSDSVNQFNAVCGRLGIVKPSCQETVKVKTQNTSLTFKRLADSRIRLPSEWRCDDKLTNAEVREDKTYIEEIIRGMGKGSSRKRMLKELEKRWNAEVEWDSAGHFKIFVKSDDKVGKLKPRLIQFVPSVAYLKVMRRLKIIVDKIKKIGSWFDPYSRNLYVWASGMSQTRLSDIAGKWAHKQPNIVFICGDDNTDFFGDADASSYDSTQRGVFANHQWRLMSELGFTDDEVEYMRSWHTGKRKATGFTYEQVEECLPSGAPWTLFLNSAGLYIYHQQVASVQNLVKCKKLGKEINRETVINTAAELFGLKMTFAPAPELNGVRFNGSEFLKGVFIKAPVRMYWVPLPSRLFKWTGKIISGNVDRKKVEKDIEEHYRAVAKGQLPFVLDPLAQIWVDAWSQDSGKIGKLEYEWKNVDQQSRMSLTPEDSKTWIDTWAPLMEQRYGIDRPTYDLMLATLKTNALKRGSFMGQAWSRIWNRDYLGSIEGE